MNIVLATENLHKKEELSSIFLDHSLFIPKDLGLSFDFEEDAPTFLGNSLGKAQTLWDVVRERAGSEPLAVLADDSGLVVPSLGGEPGIYSARYGSDVYGHMLESSERNRYLLSKLEGITDRRAFFVCCMTCILDDYTIYTVQETMKGAIIDKEYGHGGFGYDPIFFVDTYGKTVAQLKAEEKNRISHRGKAGAKLARLL